MRPDQIKFSPRPVFTEEFVLVDGITRTGKFMVASLVAAMERVEYFQYPHLLETLLYLHRLGKIDFEVCRDLLQLDFNTNTFNLMIGRSLNTREHDLSSINRSLEAQRYFDRAKQEDRDFLVNAFLAEKRIPFFINHEGLANSETLFSIFPKVKIVNILRDPVTLIYSWFRRGWGKRIGGDPKAGWASFSHPRGPTPWWAIDWADRYHDLNEMERCLCSIQGLTTMAKDSVASLSVQRRNQILFVDFDQITRDPDPTISKIEKFLGTSRNPKIVDILRRERLPRETSPTVVNDIYQKIKGEIRGELCPILDALVAEKKEYWDRFV